MGNARIWEGTVTFTEDGQTRKVDVRLINQSSADITDQTPNRHKSFWVYTGQTTQDTCNSDLYFISGQTVTTEEFERVDYNKQAALPITVKYVHIARTGQGQSELPDFDIVTDEVVEYDDINVPFYDLVEDYILASRSDSYNPPVYGELGVIFGYYDGEMTKDNIGNPIEGMTGGACGRDADPTAFGDYLLTTMHGNMTLYDFSAQKFSEDAFGKTIYIRLNDQMLC